MMGMTFLQEAVRDRPVLLFGMDDPSPYQDYSGYGRIAIWVGGEPAKHLSLAAGTKYSQVLSSTITTAYESPIFKQGKENASFSLEAVVRVIPASIPSEQQVLGNINQMDGLTINGNKVSFVVKFLTAPVAKVTHDIQQGQRVHAVGVKSQDKISLYVQGTLVKELTLSIDQQADKYAASDANLYSGATTGSQKIALGPVAAYARALDKDGINRHFLASQLLPSAQDVVSGSRGEHIPLSLSNANLFLDQWWTTNEHWENAVLSNVAIEDEQLKPIFDNGVSTPGQWMDSFSLVVGDEVEPIHGVSMNWDGTGVTIEASVDGVSWETAKRGVNLSIIPPGFDPNHKELQLRVSFPGGIIDDDSFLDNLNVVGLKTAIAPAIAGRTITYTNAYQERDYAPLAIHDNWGAEVGTGGKVSISADANTGLPVRTVELWIRRTGNTIPTISFTPSVTYQDGQVNADNLPIGQWRLVHFVASSNITGAIVISNAAQVGHVALYESALTDTQIASIYNQYTLSNPWKVADSGTIMVSESAQPVKIYAHDWSIEAAG